MIDVKEAVRKAVEYFADLYEPGTYNDLQLEEVELRNDEKYWLITLSFVPILNSPFGPDKIAKALNMPTAELRKYKQFKIHAATGKVQAMTIRKVS